MVGGAPALVSAAELITKIIITYLNDERRWPIAYGSAWHIEEDGDTEMPTSYKPTSFLWKQIWRAIVALESLKSIEKSGFCSWRTLDWIGWFYHPQAWISGMKLAVNFQLATMASPEKRQALLQEVAKKCKRNEDFYVSLNQKVGGKLLLPGKGSIIVARNDAEVADLLAFKENLAKENRELVLLSAEDMLKRYGFVPEGKLFAEKTHDRVLSPNFMSILTNYISDHGGHVLNGTLTTIYTDGKTPGGIAEYQTPDGQKNYILFSRLIMSLGSQPVLDQAGKPLFDVVAARGVSVLAFVRVPKGQQLPPVVVCGGTNHATKLSDQPTSVRDELGREWDQYLLRMTAGACITPNVSTRESVDYDASVAVGLVAAVRKTLSNCHIEPITVYGCNRQVSKYGHTQWVSPFPRMHIQYDAGGGGLTRAPDLVTELAEQINDLPSRPSCR